jgi:hypothetical protein
VLTNASWRDAVDGLMDQQSFCTALVSPHTVARYICYNSSVGIPTLVSQYTYPAHM